MKLLGNIVFDADETTRVRLQLTAIEDVWYLYNFVVPGDLVGGKTTRKVSKETGSGVTTERKVLTLFIEVQSLEFDPGGVLRLGGINRTECEFIRLNQHHRLDVTYEQQTVTVVKKEWNKYFEAQLNEACDEDARADAAAIVMEYGLSHVCIINGSMIITKQRIEIAIPKKRRLNGASRDETIQRFFHQTLEAALACLNFDRLKVVLVCSPGHVNEEFLAYVFQRAGNSDVAPQMKSMLVNRSKFLPVHVSSGHRAALNEALADKTVQAKMQITKCAQDVAIWEEFQAQLNTNPDKVCYGPQFVFEAQKKTAIATLLVSDALFRCTDAHHRLFYFNLVDEVKNFGGKVQVFSSLHLSGEQLNQLGGVAAILRWELPMDDVELKSDFFASEEASEMIRSRSGFSSRDM